MVLDERIGGRVPRRVASRLEGGAQAAGGEGGGVRLALISSLPENSMITLPSEGAEIKESCFSAVTPVSGWNQWV